MSIFSINIIQKFRLTITVNVFYIFSNFFPYIITIISVNMVILFMSNR